MNLPVKAYGAQLVDTSKIVGWGVDADPRNDPTYPIRDRSQDDHPDERANRPAIQHPAVEILESVEFARRPAVVGTSTPPSGLSGLMRRAAFRWTESNWLHWLILIGADRVNMVEGVVDDLAHARIPNVPAEMGIRSELAFNKAGFARKVGIGVALGAVVTLLVLRNRAKAIEHDG